MNCLSLLAQASCRTRGLDRGLLDRGDGPLKLVGIVGSGGNEAAALEQTLFEKGPHQAVPERCEKLNPSRTCFTPGTSATGGDVRDRIAGCTATLWTPTLTRLQGSRAPM